MIKNRKLDHIGLATTGAKEAAEWYQTVMGFHIKGKFVNCRNGRDVYFIANEDESIVYEVYTTPDLDPMLQGKIDHISYVSEDVEADYQFCLSQGYEICSDGIEGIESFWEHGIRFFKLKTTSGEEVEFCQRL